MSDAECLVVGGGPAGSMVALRLAAAGRPVVLIEKEGGPHDKVCGEFLSGEAIGYLRSEGIEPTALGAQPIRTIRLSARRTVAETELPFPALSLSRRALDEALLARAEEAGAVLRRGLTVEELARDGRLWRTDCADGSRIEARAVFLATGKHDLRGWQRRDLASLKDNLIGFKLHWRLTPKETAALRGCMELFLFHGGYGGLALVEGDGANLCLMVKRAVFQSPGGWAALLRQIRCENLLLDHRLSGAEPLWARPLAISPIPYGFMARAGRGIWRLGDQAAVIPSFTGDGMSIALHSGALAAEMYLAGASAEEYQAELGLSLRKSMKLAMRLSRASVHPVARLFGPAVLRAFPHAMRWIAKGTRIPDTALLSH